MHSRGLIAPSPCLTPHSKHHATEWPFRTRHESIDAVNQILKSKATRMAPLCQPLHSNRCHVVFLHLFVLSPIVVSVSSLVVLVRACILSFPPSPHHHRVIQSAHCVHWRTGRRAIHRVHRGTFSFSDQRMFSITNAFPLHKKNKFFRGRVFQR